MSRLDPDKPIFNTRDIADILGVTTNFVREQTCPKGCDVSDSGHLHASTNIKRDGRRILRYSLNDVLAYDRDVARRLEKDVS